MPIDVRNPATLTSIALQLIDVNKELSERIEALEPKAKAHDRIAESFGSVCRRIAARVCASICTRATQDIAKLGRQPSAIARRGTCAATEISATLARIIGGIVPM